jgi:hypothetical protein
MGGRLFHSHLPRHRVALAADPSIGRIGLSGSFRSLGAVFSASVGDAFGHGMCSGRNRRRSRGHSYAAGPGGALALWNRLVCSRASARTDIWTVSLAVAIVLGGRGPEVRLDFLIPLAAVGEEFGWRGYALPRLQTRIGAVHASLVIGLTLAAWHLPYYADPSIHPLPFWIDFGLFGVMLVSQSVLATWIYNGTGGSVLATILYHHSIHMASLVPVVPGIMGTAVMASVSVAAAVAAVALSGGSLVGPRRSTAGR